MGPSYGGPFQSVRRLAQAQSEAGLNVRVSMPWSAEAEAHIPDWSPVKTSVFGNIIVPPLGWSPDYAKRVVHEATDILHTHGLWQHPSWVALAWKRRHHQPHVCSVRGMLEPWAWRHHAWKKRPVWWLWERRNLQSASLLHATSPQEAEGLRALGLRVPIAIISNGVDLPEMPVAAVLEVEGVKKTALFLSRVHPKKGLPLLLHAWSKIMPPGWELHIVGPDEGGHRRELEHQASALGLTDVVRFSGTLTGAAKEQAFREAKLFILPTHSENFGIAVAEALAHQLPVITTYGAPWELLQSERCGWWVPVSVDGIAAALDDATRKSPEELIAMGKRGRAAVAERFAWDRIAREFIDCYRWVLGEGAKPGSVVL